MTAIAERGMPELPSATRIGQGTAVEQARAIAEVQAAIIVAQQCPRNVNRAITDMRDSCARKQLADHAFYRYPKGGGVVSGPSIKLARELARVWGNIQYGVTELRRDDSYGQSELLAFAWDVQTNARNSSTVINPHQLYTGGGGRRLTELRDVYDNNANVGARRVREAIFAVLPTWFVEEAIELCSKTLADGGGVALPQRIANAIEVFGNLGITVPQLEAKLGVKNEKWNDQDVAQLRIIRQSLMRGEIRKEDEFHDTPGRVTADEITSRAKPDEKAAPRRRRAAPKDASPAGEPQTPAAASSAALPADPAGEAQDEPERPAAKASSGQLGILRGQLEKVGYDLASPDDQQAALRVTGILAQVDDLGDLKELDQDQAARAVRWLRKCDDGAALELMLAEGEVSDE